MRKLAVAAISLSGFALSSMDAAASSGRADPPCLARPAEVIYHNGRVQTLDERFTRVEAVAVKGGRVLAVGSDEHILKTFRGCGTRVVDLGGMTVLPGYVEPHSHGFARVFWDATEELSDEEIRERLLARQEQHLAIGFTTQAELIAWPELAAHLESLAAGGELHIRTSLYFERTHSCEGTEILHLGVARIDDPTEAVRAPGVKIFADGANCDTRPALSFPPLGDLFFEQPEMSAMVTDSDRDGWQIAIHTIGDRAREQVLESYRLVLPPDGTNPRRHRIEHNNWIRPEQIAEYARLGIVAPVFGRASTCAINDAAIFDTAPDRGWFRPFRSMLAAGVRLVWHGDWGSNPPKDPDRVMGNELWGLVTRKDIVDGELCLPEPWFEAEAVTVEQAMRMVSIDAAYAVGMESVVGSLEPGKLADMVIVSHDPMTIPPDELYELRTLVTIVGGVPRFCAAGHEEHCALP